MPAPAAEFFGVSLARPGGNITGVGLLSLHLIAKRFELLSELVPQAKIVAFLVNPDVPTWKVQIENAQQAAAGKRLQIQVLYASSKEGIDSAFASLAAVSHADALVVGSDAFLYRQRDQIAALASRSTIPAIYDLRQYVDAGGLMNYDNNVVATYRQAARIVGKVLGGAKPSEIPVEQPTKFELVINLKTAKALGLTVPQSLLARADEVIE